MLKKKTSSRVLAAIFVLMTFVATPLSGLGQNVSPVAPKRTDLEAVMSEAYEKFKNDPGGKNADYIPYLAKVDSKLFGIAIVTVDGRAIS